MAEPPPCRPRTNVGNEGGGGQQRGGGRPSVCDDPITAYWTERRADLSGVAAAASGRAGCAGIELDWIELDSGQLDTYMDTFTSF